MDDITRALEDYPPAGNVAWRVWTLAPVKFREDTVDAHSWFEARIKGAELFGCLFECVDAVRAEGAMNDAERADASVNRCA